MIKKLAAAFLALTLIFTPAGNFIFHQDIQQASAKGYHSGVKSFHSGGSTGTSSFFKTKQQQRNTPSSTTSRTTRSQGGFLKGMLFGGLAGLLFGGLLSNLGGLGTFVGLLLNILIIVFIVVALIALIRYIVSGIFRSKRKNEETNPWKRP